MKPTGKMVGTVLGLAVMGLAPSWGSAQVSEIRGRVMDSETGEAVDGATVVMEGQDTAFLMVTDDRGLFGFDAVGAGDYRVQVTHLAYGEHEQYVSVEPDAVLALRILISRQAIELGALPADLTAHQLLPEVERGFPAALPIASSDQVALLIIQQRQIHTAGDTAGSEFHRSPDIDQGKSIDDQVMEIVF